MNPMNPLITFMFPDNTYCVEPSTGKQSDCAAFWLLAGAETWREGADGKPSTSESVPPLHPVVPESKSPLGAIFCALTTIENRLNEHMATVLSTDIVMSRPLTFVQEVQWRALSREPLAELSQLEVQHKIGTRR